MAALNDQQYLNALVENERPGRMVGLFPGHSLKPADLTRLVDACVRSMREEDGGASLTVAPLGVPDVEQQHTFRGTAAAGAAASPHDCVGQLFDGRDAPGPHRGLLDHIGGRDEELS